MSAVVRISTIAAAAWLLSGCTDEHATVITVKTRAAVRGAAALEVVLKNGAGVADDSFEVRGKTFPLTFSVSTTGRTGDLEVKLSARDEAGLLVGRGTTSLPISAATGEVMIEPADFVVNTSYPQSQYLTQTFESAGSQLAATSAGEWLVSYREDCTATACNVLARRFDRTGQALSSALAAGTGGFAVNTAQVGLGSSPVTAAGASKTLLFWETFSGTAVDGVACRALDSSGAGAAEKRLVTELSTAAITATALPNGTFAAAWTGRAVNTEPVNIRTVVVDASCTPLGAVQPVGTEVPAVAGLRQSAIAAGPAASGIYLLAWRAEDAARAEGAIRARTITTAGVPASADTALLTPAVGEDYTMVRLAAYEGGYAMVVGHRVGTAFSLELYRVAASTGTAPSIIGSATLVTDKFENAFSGFSMATRPQGPILVTWHGCDARGDGEGCGVFGRLFATSGTALTSAFLIPTTTALDQVNSAATAFSDADGQPVFAVAWNDASAQPPDTVGTAVRARLVYPPAPSASVRAAAGR